MLPAFLRGDQLTIFRIIVRFQNDFNSSVKKLENKRFSLNELKSIYFRDSVKVYKNAI